MKITKELINSRIKEFLLSLQYLLEIEDKDLCDYFEITESQLLQLKQSHFELDTIKLMNFCEKFHISFESIIKRTVNFNSVLNHFNKNLDYIPHEYLMNARSKMRTVTPVYGYMMEKFGEPLANSLLRHFQIRKEALMDPSKLISINLLKDLMGYISSLGFDDAKLFEMGQYSYQQNKNGILQIMGNEFDSEYSFVEFITQEAQAIFDECYYYKLQKLSKTNCLIEVEHRDDVCEMYGTKYLGSLDVDKYKIGVISSLSVYTGFNMANVSIKKNVHQGDSKTLFEIQFSDTELTL